MVLPGKITVKGERSEFTRAQRAPFTVIFHGNTIVGTVGRITRTNRLSAVPETA
jgi:hypothetical protein